jgi:hypothetical protein
MSSGNSLLIVRMATPLRDPVDQFVDLGLGAHVDSPGWRALQKGRDGCAVPLGVGSGCHLGTIQPRALPRQHHLGIDSITNGNRLLTNGGRPARPSDETSALTSVDGAARAGHPRLEERCHEQEQYRPKDSNRG